MTFIWSHLRALIHASIMPKLYRKRPTTFKFKLDTWHCISVGYVQGAGIQIAAPWFEIMSVFGSKPLSSHIKYFQDCGFQKTVTCTYIIAFYAFFFNLKDCDCFVSLLWSLSLSRNYCSSLSPLVVIQNHGYVVFIYKINSIYFHFCTFLELYSIKEIVVIDMPMGCSLWAALGIAF